MTQIFTNNMLGKDKWKGQLDTGRWDLLAQSIFFWSKGF